MMENLHFGDIVNILDTLRAITLGTLILQGAVIVGSSRLLAEIAGPGALHHFFNARLLNAGEYQINVLTNGKIGITDTLEVGSNLLLTAGRYYNLAIKHKMFAGEKFQTAFTSFSVYWESSQVATLASLQGVVTTHVFSPTIFINWGLFDGLIFARKSDRDTGFMHAPILTFGNDFVLSRAISVSAIIAKPLFISTQIKSEYGDFDVKDSYLTDKSTSFLFGFLTMTLSFDVFHMEAGGLILNNAAMPYLNAWWRFN